MKFELQWTIDAVRDLQLLDELSADRITKKVSWFCSQTNPLRHAEPLTGTYKGIHRFRVAAYRVLFEIDAKGHIHILTVLRIKHRSEAYR